VTQTANTDRGPTLDAGDQAVLASSMPLSMRASVDTRLANGRVIKYEDHAAALNMTDKRWNEIV